MTADQQSLIEALRRSEENLPHLLDVAVQILEDEGLLPAFEEVLSLDLEAARDDAGERIADALTERREGAKCCTYRSFDYGNSCRCVLVEGHEGGHVV